jgi:hypothetical protein
MPELYRVVPIRFTEDEMQSIDRKTPHYPDLRNSGNAQTDQPRDARTRDNGKVRLGDSAPARFGNKATHDAGKVRIGDGAAPSFGKR